MLYTILYMNFGNSMFKLGLKNIYIYQYWLFLIILWICFLTKTYFNYWLLQLLSTSAVIIFLMDGFNLNCSILGDALVLLCITTLMISWVFLSERFIYLNSYNNIYFFIFIVFTINMVYSDNLFIMFIFFEFIFLPSLFFVYILGYSKKVEKTIKYLLIWTLTGSFIVLCGLVYLNNITGNLNIQYLFTLKFTQLENNFLYIIFLIGFGVKIPLWPFHYWLTKVHVEAPTGFSIFLSGYLVKTALFCLIYFINLFKTTMLIYITLAWIMWGALEASVRMWSATDIKRLIAFATIQEMNLILLFVLLTNNSSYKILTVFIMVHGLLSALLFFLVDQVQKRCQTRNLTSLSGLVYKLTVLPVIIWISILIFRGFPIFSKFLIEWEILSLLYQNFNYFGIIIFFLISLFGVLGFCRIWFIILYGQPSNVIIKPVDLLKTDKIICLFIITLLTFISFFLLFLSD